MPAFGSEVRRRAALQLLFGIADQFHVRLIELDHFACHIEQDECIHHILIELPVFREDDAGCKIRDAG